MGSVDRNSRVPQSSSNHVGKSPALPPKQQVVKEVGENTIKGTPTQNMKSNIKGTRGSGNQKTDTVVQQQLPSTRPLPPTPQERAPLDMGPTKKAPTLVTVAELKIARTAIDKARNEFVAMMKSGSVPFSKYEDLATTLSFHERRVMGSKASQKEKTEFQKHASEDRQMMFNRLNDDVKTMLQQNKGDLSQTMRACQSILSGTSLIIDTSGASKEKQTYITGEIQKSVVSTLLERMPNTGKTPDFKADLQNFFSVLQELPISNNDTAKEQAIVGKIKGRMPTAKQGITPDFKADLQKMFQVIKELPISDEVKASIKQQVAQELKARFAK